MALLPNFLKGNRKIDIKGKLPQKACSVNENFIVIKKTLIFYYPVI